MEFRQLFHQFVKKVVKHSKSSTKTHLVSKVLNCGILFHMILLESRLLMISNPSSLSSCYSFLTSRLFVVTPPQTRTPYWHGIKTEKLQVSGVVRASDGLLNLNETFQRYQRYYVIQVICCSRLLGFKKLLSPWSVESLGRAENSLQGVYDLCSTSFVNISYSRKIVDT